MSFGRRIRDTTLLLGSSSGYVPPLRSPPHTYPHVRECVYAHVSVRRSVVFSLGFGSWVSLDPVVALSSVLFETGF